jgi:leucine efflux protein
MFGISDYGAFVVAVVVFLAIPGPGNLALLTATGQGGLRAGFAAAFGVIAGDQVLLWLAVAGVSAVLLANPSVYDMVRLAGAFYLLGLGVALLRTQVGGAAVMTLKPDHYFRQAWLITVLNPKAIVFYMAFFPLFIDPVAQQGVLTLAVMAATIAVVTLVYCVVVVLLAYRLADRFRSSPLLAAMLNKLAGALLVAFAVKMAFFK